MKMNHNITYNREKVLARTRFDYVLNNFFIFIYILKNTLNALLIFILFLYYNIRKKSKIFFVDYTSVRKYGDFR